MSRQNVEVVRRLYEALNRGATAGGTGSWVEIYDAEAQYEPAEEAGIISGHEQLVRYFQRWLEVWSQITWEVEDIVDADDRLIGIAVIRGTARESGVEITQRFFHVFDVQDGKVARQREYLDRREALEAVGLRESASS